MSDRAEALALAGAALPYFQEQWERVPNQTTRARLDSAHRTIELLGDNLSEAKNWGVRDISGMFGSEPFLAATEREARTIWGGDTLSVMVRRADENSQWEVVTA